MVRTSEPPCNDSRTQILSFPAPQLLCLPIHQSKSSQTWRKKFTPRASKLKLLNDKDASFENVELSRFDHCDPLFYLSVLRIPLNFR